jgi:uncharacterized protein (DUF433 family)
MTDWKETITADPDVMVGKPVIAGTRLTVEFIVERLADGWSEDELVQNYPGLNREQIHACLAFAAEMLSEVQMYSLPLRKSLTTSARPLAPD